MIWSVRGRSWRGSGLPLRCPGVDPEALSQAMLSDKKVAGGALRWVLLDEIGKGYRQERRSPGPGARDVNAVVAVARTWNLFRSCSKSSWSLSRCFLLGFGTAAYGAMVGAGGGFIFSPVLVFIRVGACRCGGDVPGPGHGDRNIGNPGLPQVGTDRPQERRPVRCRGYAGLRNRSLRRVNGEREHLQDTVRSAAGRAGRPDAGATQPGRGRRREPTTRRQMPPMEVGESLPRTVVCSDTGSTSRPQRYSISVLGFISSFFGIAGGPIRTPVLVHFFNFPVRVAVATSLFALSFYGAAGAVVYGLLGPHRVVPDLPVGRNRLHSRCPGGRSTGRTGRGLVAPEAPVGGSCSRWESCW